MDILTLYQKASDNAEKYIMGIPADAWGKQSVCTEWTVKDLVNHMVYEALWQPDMLAGKTVAEVGDRYEGDVLKDDPINAWKESRQKADESLEHADLAKICHLSFADLPCSEYISQRILDLTIHGWDVAKSTGQQDELDPELVQFVYEFIQPQQKMIAESGVFGPQIKVSEDADIQTKLLGMLGRKR